MKNLMKRGLVRRLEEEEKGVGRRRKPRPPRVSCTCHTFSLFLFFIYKKRILITHSHSVEWVIDLTESSVAGGFTRSSGYFT